MRRPCSDQNGNDVISGIKVTQASCSDGSAQGCYYCYTKNVTAIENSPQYKTAVESIRKSTDSFYSSISFFYNSPFIILGLFPIFVLCNLALKKIRKQKIEVGLLLGLSFVEAGVLWIILFYLISLGIL